MRYVLRIYVYLVIQDHFCVVMLWEGYMTHCLIKLLDLVIDLQSQVNFSISERA